jgi:hypothetical protein
MLFAIQYKTNYGSFAFGFFTLSAHQLHARGEIFSVILRVGAVALWFGWFEMS